ncbi:MAG: ABC transporter permease [Anaerolineae bacterium]|nr:ABC transporter permease [Anaerolineae bacterium]
MLNLGLWLRWSWRDLRAQWLQVIVIALIIALGTGVYAGLGSTTPWRRDAADKSYTLLNMFDLRVNLTGSTYVDQAELMDAIRAIPHAEWIKAAEPRLIESTLVSASAGGEDIIVRGRLVSLDVAGGGPHVNGVSIQAGRALTGADAGQNVVLLDYHFARHYNLPAQGQIELSGGIPVQYVGHSLSPEYFMIITDDGGFLAEANFAVLFAPLETVQALTGHAGMVNNLVLTLHDSADADIIRAEIETALKAAFPRIGVSFTGKDDERVHQLVYQTIDMNQEIYNIIIVLFLAGAVLGAFNLSSRMVESQRRQIGIGMALGLPPRLLAVRPLLIGAQIALLGAVLGAVMGVLMGKLAAAWLLDVLPMPTWGRLFQWDVFLEAAVLGFVLPFVAALLPVWRAVRVMPVAAIRFGHLVEKGNGWTPLAKRVSLPGKSFVQMPIRNLLRAPRRTLFTVLGIATAITTLVGLTGMLNSAQHGMDALAAEYYQDHPDRHVVYLNGFYPTDSEQIAAITSDPIIAMSVPALRLAGHMTYGDTSFFAIIQVLDMDNELWAPTLLEGVYRSDTPGILISDEAAKDLEAGLGDTIILEHPRRTGLLAYDIVETEIEVIGIHADLWNTLAYLDQNQAGLMGLSGVANLIHVDPVPGTSSNETKNALFRYPGVASVVSVTDTLDSSSAVLDEVIRFLSGVQVGVILLAFLIAFSSTNINLHEREREIATMFAFGLRIRTVTRMTVLENLVVGVLGTLIGSVLGYLVLAWFVYDRMPVILPEFQFNPVLAPITFVMAVVIGVIVVALAPLALIRRMARMDIPSTLRVME